MPLSQTFRLLGVEVAFAVVVLVLDSVAAVGPAVVDPFAGSVVVGLDFPGFRRCFDPAFVVAVAVVVLPAGFLQVRNCVSHPSSRDRVP